MTRTERLSAIEDFAREIRTIDDVLARFDRDDAGALRLRRAALAYAMAGHARAVAEEVRS